MKLTWLHYLKFNAVWGPGLCCTVKGSQLHSVISCITGCGISTNKNLSKVGELIWPVHNKHTGVTFSTKWQAILAPSDLPVSSRSLHFNDQFVGWSECDQLRRDSLQPQLTSSKVCLEEHHYHYYCIGQHSTHQLHCVCTYLYQVEMENLWRHQNHC